WLSDGTLEFLGRVDDQVKVRGFRIELGEIEAALARIEGVGQAAVAMREEDGQRDLVAYVVSERAATEESAATEAGLRARLKEALPGFMVPSRFVFLDALPRTANGKLDRDALPAPGALARGADDVVVLPRTSAEEAVAAVWREVLALDRISVHDN